MSLDHFPNEKPLVSRSTPMLVYPRVIYIYIIGYKRYIYIYIDMCISPIYVYIYVYI